MNKNSQLYNLPQVFDVYQQSKSKLNVKHTQPSSDTEFTNASVRDIYHFAVANDLNSNGANSNPAAVNSTANATENIVGAVSPSDHEIQQTSTAPVPKLMIPSQINWYYLDQSLNQQGPFNGDLMQGWYNDGYLSRDLQVRIENGEYQTLDAFCKSVDNYVSPFQVPLPDPTAVPAAPAVTTATVPDAPVVPDTAAVVPDPVFRPDLAPSVSSGSMSLNTSFQKPLFDLNYFQMNNFGQIQNPVLARPNSSWGLDYSAPSTPLASINMNQMAFNSQPAIQPSIQQPTIQPTPISPWVGSRVQSQSRVNSPFVTEPDLNLGSAVSGLLDDLELSVRAPVQPTALQSDISPNVAVPEEIVQPRVVVPEEIVQPNVVVPEEIVQPKVVVPEETQPVVVEEISQPVVVVPQEEVRPTVEESVEELIPQVKQLKPTSSTKESKAPWAKEASSTPKLTLKEIQRLENEKSEKQRQAEALMKLEAQAALLNEEKQRELEKKKVLPSTIGWASATSNQAKVVKTLAEIQEEERKLAELTRKKTPTLASAIAVSAPVEDGWSTVAKKVSKKPSVSVLNKSSTMASSSSTTNPQLLRTVSSSVVVPKQDNSQSLREEFIIWARSQMTNLYPLVSANDLLEMFISLPNNQDSIQLITETIYSSSTTMNSRVFAHEFMKKKAHYNKQISNSEDLTAWSAAIVSSSGKLPVKDEDGWSTTKRKKGRK